MGWGFIPSLDNAIGNSLYTTSGAKESAKMQFKHQMALQKDAQDFAKWQMQNAHQTEIQDLQNAGLNPVLSAGGSGASAGVSMGSANAGSGAIDPIGAIGTIVGAMNNAKQTNANIKEINTNIKNNTDRTNADIKNETKRTNAEVVKNLADAGWTQKQIDHYIKYGVPMGSSVTTSSNTPWGGSSETVPIGYTPITSDANPIINSAKKGYENQQSKFKTKKDTEKEIKKIHDKYGNWWY